MKGFKVYSVNVRMKCRIALLGLLGCAAIYWHPGKSGGEPTVPTGVEPQLADIVRAAQQREKEFTHYDCQMHGGWFDPGEDKAFKVRTYHWIRSDKKLFLDLTNQSFIATDPAQPDYQFACDGQDCRLYEPSTRTGVIYSDPSAELSRPTVYSVESFFSTLEGWQLHPFSSVLHGDAVPDGIGTPMFPVVVLSDWDEAPTGQEPTYLVTIKLGQLQQHLHLTRRYGWCITRVESFAMRDKKPPLPLSRVEYSDFEKVSGDNWYPREAVYTLLDSTGKPSQLIKLKIDKLSLDEKIDPGKFHLSFPEGTHVTDRSPKL